MGFCSLCLSQTIVPDIPGCGSSSVPFLSTLNSLICTLIVRFENIPTSNFLIPDEGFGDNIPDPIERSESWQFFYKCISIRVYAT